MKDDIFSGLSNIIPVSKTLYDMAENVSFADFNLGEEVKLDDEVISPEEVSKFLKLPSTIVYVIKGENEEDNKLIGYNLASQKMIEVSNLGNHISGLNFIFAAAVEKWEELQANPNKDIISKELMCELHSTLFKLRAECGEKGFGEFRDLLYNGRPADVGMFLKPDEFGNRKLNPYWQPPRAGGKNIEKHIDALIDWTRGGKEYKVKDEMWTRLNPGEAERFIHFPPFETLSPIERAVRFHVEFVRIQPFSDGNRRAGRMLLEYMLTIQGEPLVNIHRQEKEAYMDALNLAISTGNFEPMIKLVEASRIENSSELYSATLEFYVKDNKIYKNNISRPVKRKEKPEQKPKQPLDED